MQQLETVVFDFQKILVAAKFLGRLTIGRQEKPLARVGFNLFQQRWHLGKVGQKSRRTQDCSRKAVFRDTVGL
jgi:hypothetical protein